MGKKKVYPNNLLIFREEHYFNNIINLATECINRNHSAVFPIELPGWFIKLFTKKGDIVVLDPFLGIGTTALSCVLLERSYIGIEIVKEYAQEAKNNVAKLKRMNSR